MRIRIGSVLFLVVTGAIVFAQNTPPPRGKATAAISGKSITIDYGRPALKGRSMDDLFKQLPPDRVWRAGQNQVTTLTTEGDILVGAKKVPAGKYSVYVHISPAGDWSLILNKDLGIELVKIWPKAPPNMAREPWPYYEDYTEKIGKQEVARAAMKAEKVSAPVDMFTIDLSPNKGGAALKMTWGDRSCSADIAPAK
jgi:hypothetical protein